MSYLENIYYTIKKFDSFTLYTEGVSDEDLRYFVENNLDEIRSSEPTELGFNEERKAYFIYEWKTYEVEALSEFPFVKEDYFFQGKRNKVSNTATLKLENFVGVIRFRNQVFEVHSEKMSREKVMHLVRYINNKIMQLPFKFGVNALSQTRFKREKYDNENFNKFIYVYYLLSSGELFKAINTILRNPFQSIESNLHYIDFSQVTHLDSENISDIFSGTTVFQKTESDLPVTRKLKGYLPDRIHQYEHVTSYDNNENQFVLFFLKFCVRTLNSYLNEFNLSHNQRYFEQGDILTKLNKYKSDLNRTTKSRVFSDISHLTLINKSSTVLTKRAGYKEIYKFFLNIKSVPVSSIKKDDFIDLFENKSIDKLYEYASLFYLSDYLKEIYSEGTINKDIMFTKKNYSIVLDERNDKVKFQYTKEGYPKSTLYFQRSYTPTQKTSYAILQSPDFSLLIENKKGSYLYHFDAKFKVKTFDTLYTGLESTFAKEEDLKSMHAYRDGVKGTCGAYVLYPGNHNSRMRIYSDKEKSDYINSKDYFSGIGSIPLEIDSENIQLKKFLKELIVSHID